MVVSIDRFAVGGAVSVGNPNSGAGAHHRLERRNQAAGGMLDLDSAIRRVLMNIWLAVRKYDDLFAVQMSV
jgi:hypothetical protein